MNLFGNDVIIGNFKFSDYGLMLGSFDISNSNVEDELGMDYEVIEEFIGYNPVPIYLGGKHTNKLKPQITIVKNTCQNREDPFFSEHECREVLRQLTGFNTYKNMQILIDNIDELLYFNVITRKVSYQKINGMVAGIVLYLECDSQFAWSQELIADYNVNHERNVIFNNNSDDLYNYLLPKVTIISKTPVDILEIKNVSDNNWTTTISNLSANEIITMDCKNEILTSSISNKAVLDNFNMHFMRFLSGENIFQINHDIELVITYRLPRKVGFI